RPPTICSSCWPATVSAAPSWRACSAADHPSTRRSRWASAPNDMRVILVGPAAARARLRARADGVFSVVGEAADARDARASGVAADALLVPLARDDEETPPAVEELTAREIEVLELLAEGLSNKGIAA